MSADAVEVLPVVTRRDRRAFLCLPWRIYRDDPLWVPPLMLERRWFISERHPFRKHGEASLFLARRGGEVVGRIMASNAPDYHGCFGMFESVNDADVARALLDAAAGWVRDRGRKQILGPIDYSTNYNCGLLIDGFDTPPRVMMNHNPPWYAKLLESWGLTKARDLYCWWGDSFNDEAQSWIERLETWLARDDVTIRPLNRKRWREEMRLFKTVYHEAWQDNWGFVRMTDAELDAMSKWLYHLGDPRLILLAEAQGRPVGFSIHMPDVHEALRPLNGRLLPLGWWRLWRGLSRIRTVRYLILGVVPAFRNRGVAERMAVQSALNVVPGEQYTQMEISWVLEENERLYKPFARLGVRRYKTYRIYQRDI